MTAQTIAPVIFGIAGTSYTLTAPHRPPDAGRGGPRPSDVASGVGATRPLHFLVLEFVTAPPQHQRLLTCVRWVGKNQGI